MNKIAGTKQIQYYLSKLVETKNNYFQDVMHDRFVNQHDRAPKTIKICSSCIAFWHGRVSNTHDRARMQFKIYPVRTSTTVPLGQPYLLPLGQARSCVN